MYRHIDTVLADGVGKCSSSSHVSPFRHTGIVPLCRYAWQLYANCSVARSKAHTCLLSHVVSLEIRGRTAADYFRTIYARDDEIASEIARVEFSNRISFLFSTVGENPSRICSRKQHNANKYDAALRRIYRQERICLRLQKHVDIHWLSGQQHLATESLLILVTRKPRLYENSSPAFAYIVIVR